MKCFKINKNKRIKGGFTLTELLAVIVILTIIFSIIIGIFNVSNHKVDKKIDAITKNLI